MIHRCHSLLSVWKLTRIGKDICRSLWSLFPKPNTPLKINTMLLYCGSFVSFIHFLYIQKINSKPQIYFFLLLFYAAWVFNIHSSKYKLGRTGKYSCNPRVTIAGKNVLIITLHLPCYYSKIFLYLVLSSTL